MMLKLPADFKAKWLAELRDPNTRQAQGVLANWQGMCCLGVACKIHDPSTFSTRPIGKRFVTKNGAVHMPNLGDVPDEVFAVLHQDISNVLGGSPDGYIASYLSGRNDGGWTFAQIADWIEKHL